MTDYLEELLRGRGQALEEARRRLEELLSPLQPTNSSETKDGKWISPEEGMPALLEAGRGGPPSDESADSDESLTAVEGRQREPPAAAGRGAWPEGEAARARAAWMQGMTGEEEREELPLLEEVRTLETRRAGVGAGLPGGTRDRGAWADLSGLGSRNVSGSGPLSMPAGLGGQLPGGGTVQSVGQNWAEEVDRTFRRDSRRYDGGFFLY